MIKNKIRRSTELYAAANERKAEGDKDLAEFILSHSNKTLQELIQNTWELENATVNLEQEDTKSMDIITMASEGEHEEGCRDQWLRATIAVLTNNYMHPVVFADAVRTILEKGRGNIRNIMVTEPATCGKTFLFTPLQSLLKTFSYPANNKYTWLGAESTKMIFLNNFHYSHEMIVWKQMLLLLEGQVKHLPSPKDH